MPTTQEINSTYDAKFNEMGITDEMFNAVIAYLTEVGVYTSCGTRTGCDGSCESGQTCKELIRGNCACAKS